MHQPGVVRYGASHTGFRPELPGQSGGYRQRADSINEAMADSVAMPLPVVEPLPVVVVTRHQAVLDWLSSRGFPVYEYDEQDNRVLRWEVLSHVSDPAQVAGKIVIGALPLHLAAVTACVGTIDMPGLRPDQRGRELSLGEMAEAGAELNWYVVRERDIPAMK